MLGQRPTPTGKAAGQPPGGVGGRSDLDEGWRMDPVLELWVDADGRLATLRLRGLLDDRTGRTVRRVVDDLLADGHVEVMVDVGGLEVRGGAGFATLVDLEQDVRLAGGRTRWDGWSALRVVSGEERGGRARPPQGCWRSDVISAGGDSSLGYALASKAATNRRT
ncbi:MAG: STAS domain-containing protein [Acidimicrobiales bacterium]